MRHEETPPRLALGILICLVAYIFFITASSLVRNLGDEIPTIQIVFIQNFSCLCCIFPFALRNGVHSLKTNVFHLHLIRDLAGVASYFLYFLSISYIQLTDATILNYSAPFFVPLIWWIWMREKIKIHVWWSIIVGFIGAAVILDPSSLSFQKGFVYGLLAGLLSAVVFASLRVINLKKETVLRTLFYLFFMSTLVCAPFAYFYWVFPTSFQWTQLILIGLSTVAAQMLLTLAYQHGTASYLSPLSYSAVIYAAIISWLIFDHPPTLRTVIGACLIISGRMITYILKQKAS